MKSILANLLAVFIALVTIPAFGQQKLTLHHHDAAHQLPGTIVVPASDFFTDFPEGDSSGGGYGRRGEATAWEFNNNSLTLGVAGDVSTKIPVKECGTYQLFVRGSGTATSSFHVAIDGKQDSATFGQGAMGLQRGGDCILKPGTVEIKLTSIQPRPVFNVLVLTKNANFKEDVDYYINNMGPHLQRKLQTTEWTFIPDPVESYRLIGLDRFSPIRKAFSTCSIRSSGSVDAKSARI